MALHKCWLREQNIECTRCMYNDVVMQDLKHDDATLQAIIGNNHEL